MDISSQLSPPTTLSATYKIITPMFIGDAEQNATWISPMSFKGALRFWWRALVWARIRQGADSDEKALQTLHREEAIVFGSSAEDPEKANDRKACIKNYGKGAIAIKIANTENLKKTQSGEKHSQLQNYPAMRYLGYGVVTAFGRDRGKLTRDCLNENQTFNVKVMFDNDVYVDEVKNALILLGLLGNLGSKARKGYGSINLVGLEENNHLIYQPPADFKTYNELLNQLLSSARTLNEQPPFSAFSAESFISQIGSSSDCYAITEQYGRAMMFYRSWGNRRPNDEFHKVLDKKAEQNFKDDHDWSKAPNDNQYRDFHPKRVVFGLPHNYGKSLKVSRNLNEGKEGRRASPLFFHVQEIGGKYFGIATVLKSQFLPKSEKIKVGRNTVTQHIDWDILIQSFLTGKVKHKGNDTTARRFPDATIIFSGDSHS